MGFWKIVGMLADDLFKTAVKATDKANKGTTRESEWVEKRDRGMASYEDMKSKFSSKEDK